MGDANARAQQLCLEEMAWWWVVGDADTELTGTVVADSLLGGCNIVVASGMVTTV